MGRRRKGWARLNKPRAQHRSKHANKQPQAGISNQAQATKLTAAPTATPANTGSEHVQTATSQNQAIPDAAAGKLTAIPSQGSGGRRFSRAEDGLRHVESSKLEARAVREGWVGKGNWNLDMKPADFAELLKTPKSELSIRESILLGVLNGANSPDPRIQQIAVRSGVTMHGQNLSNNHHADRMDYHERQAEARGGLRGGVNVEVGGGGSVQIFIPHNFRDPIPGTLGPVAIPGEILEAQTIDETDPDFDD